VRPGLAPALRLSKSRLTTPATAGIISPPNCSHPKSGIPPRSARRRGICTAPAIRRPPRVSRPLLSALASSWVPLRIYLEEILSALRVLGEWTGFRRD